MHVEISIVIVNYKSWKHLEKCLESLDKIIQDLFKLQVIVVDNQSGRGKIATFIKKFPNYHFIVNSGNYGFSNGCNLGASKAIGKYLLFLNPDTIVTKDALATMLDLIRLNADYGVVSCSKTNFQGKLEKEIRFFPSLPMLLGVSRAVYKLFNNKRISEKYNLTRDVVFPDWVSGSIILTSRDWFNKINGWCEDYWLYLEDVDFCKKITKAGGKIALTRRAKIIHNHGGASRINVKTSALTKTEVIVSKHIYIDRHFKSLVKYLAQFILFISIFSSKLILAIFGLILFFLPKLYINTLIFKNLISYYFNALIKGTWISKRAPNYLK